ncbi:MAG TPA: SDR family oxidoreductase [Candidatus Dormibacteraeota bacterium]|nr:SDR family oxidoreductase [Candidatus Dormibacteraeota bacterium]
MILVTGATGKTGRHLTGELVRRGERVRAFVRNPAAAAAALGPEVEIVAGDLDRADTLAAAMSGVDRLYLLAPPSPGLATVEAGALEVARRAGVRRIVKHSAIDAGPAARSSIARLHAAGEQVLAASGLDYTILRGSMFMQNFLLFAESIAVAGEIRAPMRNGRCAFVDCVDLAAVAAAVLTEDGHHGRTYVVTGPEALSGEDAAARLSAALARPVRYVDCMPEETRALLRVQGSPEWMVADMLASIETLAAGEVDQVTDVVERVAGRPPRTFAVFARYAAPLLAAGAPS